MIRSYGAVRYMNTDYVLFITYAKVTTEYYLATVSHRLDVRAKALNQEVKYEERTAEFYTHSKSYVESDYLAGILIKKFGGNELLGFGNYSLISDIIDSINSAMSYGFKVSDQQDAGTLSVTDKGEMRRTFRAQDDRIRVNLVSYDFNPVELEVASQVFYLNMGNALAVKHFPMKQHYADVLTPISEEAFSQAAKYTTARTISYGSVLSEMSDSEWVKTKNYSSIQNNDDYRKIIIDGIVSEIKTARSNNTLPVLVGLDTETTGLDCFALPADKQHKVVSIPISWRDNEGYLVCTDMEYMDNVDEWLVSETLELLFSKNDELDSVRKIQLSDNSYFEFHRSELYLIGQNFMFDIRAFRTINAHIWYDMDTRQMSFTLDPFLTKGSNGLKQITRKLFGCETPELTDVLGEKNADKFKYIADVKLAELYGGCDGDFTRLSYKGLRKIFNDCLDFHGTDLFSKIQSQDIYLMNVFANADYDGLTIDRDMFVSLGKTCLDNINIILDFAKECVDKVLFARTKEIMKQHGLPTPQNVDSKYEFEMKGQSLRDTLFNQLNYPVLTWTVPSKASKDANKKTKPPQPAINALAMKRLLSYKLATPSGLMEEDLKDSNGEVMRDAKGEPLVSAKKFNSYKYPIAYLVSIVGPLQKEYDAYYKPFITGKYGNKLFTTTSFASIDTRRISNRYQMIKSSLKDYVYPENEDYYHVDFDIAQVEIRVVASLAKNKKFMAALSNPEVDPHTEVAAQIGKKSPSQVNQRERKFAKTVNFGYVYGLGAWKMCEDINGDNSEAHMRETFQTIEKFEIARDPEIRYLNEVRDNTLKPLKNIPASLRSYLNLHDFVEYGRVQNALGFYKLFSLENLDNWKTQRIRRQAGNFPIQGTASEIFRMMLKRFFSACDKKGWIENRLVVPHIPVHDELLFSVHKSIDPVEVARMLYKSCVFTVSGHCPYYIGVAFGNSWGDCKRDDAELPLRFLSEMSKNTDFHMTGNNISIDMRNQRVRFLSKRIEEVMGAPVDNVIDVREILRVLNNYTVKKYVVTTYKPLYEVKTADEEDYFSSCLAAWALDRYGKELTFLDYNGVEHELKELPKPLVKKEEKSKILDKYVEEENWDLDDNVNEYSRMLFSDDVSEEEYELSVDGSTEYDKGILFKCFTKSPDSLVIRTSSSAKLVRIPEHIDFMLSKSGDFLVQLIYGATVKNLGYVNADSLSLLDKLLLEVI